MDKDSEKDQVEGEEPETDTKNQPTSSGFRSPMGH